MWEQSSLSGSSSSESFVRAFRSVAIREENVFDHVEEVAGPAFWEESGALPEFDVK